MNLSVTAGDPAACFFNAEVVSPAVPILRLQGWVESCGKSARGSDRKAQMAAFSDPVPVQGLAIQANELGSETPLNVPSQATVRVYFQFLPEEDVAAAIEGIQDSLKRFEATDLLFRKHPIEWKAAIGAPLLGHELAADHAWTRRVARSAAALLERKPVITAAPFPTMQRSRQKSWSMVLVWALASCLVSAASLATCTGSFPCNACKNCK